MTAQEALRKVLDFANEKESNSISYEELKEKIFELLDDAAYDDEMEELGSLYWSTRGV